MKWACLTTENNKDGNRVYDLREVSQRYNSTLALDAVDLRVDKGEILAVVGPSGSGKSTLLRILAGALRPGQGQVEIRGRQLRDYDAKALRALRADTGFIYQDHRLVPGLRVSQNVLLGRLGRAGLLASSRSVLFPSHAELREAYEVLDRVGIEEKLFERSDRLSGGQQQRVAIARALYQAPCFLLADEPIASLDPLRSRDILRLLTEVARERGLTLLLSMHDLVLAREFCPRLVGLRRGRVCFDKPTPYIQQRELDKLYRLEASERIDDGAVQA